MTTANNLSRSLRVFSLKSEHPTVMKTILTVIALSLVLTTSSIVTFGQTSGDSKKAKSTPSQGNESVAKTSTLASTIAAEPDTTPKAPNTKEASTDIYRVGLGDVLDIRLISSVTANRSTLFTVVAGGMIDFPLAGGPIQVAGLTTEEIQTRLSTELKRRAVEENAQVSVGVRQYVRT